MSGPRPTERGPTIERDLASELELTIERLGAAGDGIGMLGADRVFVPLALPGERWLVRIERRTADGVHARALRRLSGEERAAPPCAHFGLCGGCALQHLPDALYAELKLARLHGALRQARLECPEPAPLQRSPLSSRRRIRLAFTRDRNLQVRLGYRQRAGQAIVPVARCPIAAAPLQALLRPLAALLRLEALRVDRRGGEVTATLTPAGIDLVVEGVAAATLEAREHLAAFAEAHDLARLCLGEAGAEPLPAVTRRPPQLQLGSYAVDLPPTGFLQATLEGERALQAAVAGWSAGTAKVLDLYAGLGTLTLPLPEAPGRLHLVEGNAAMVHALRRALAGRHAGRWTVEQRDLDQRPLGPPELSGFELAVLDPPRQGARAQVAELALAKIASCIYVSCDPASFARDARVLVDAGFALEAVVPIDQFLFTPHLELAALFRR